MHNIEKISRRLAAALILERPIAFFDLETTGVKTQKDKIVEIYIHKIHPDGTYETYYSLVDPGVPIPEEASKTHGIFAKDLIGSPKFDEVGPEVEKFIAGCDIGGYNSNKFDIPLLMEELFRIGIVLDHTVVDTVDARVVFVRNEGRSLSDAYKFYTGDELDNAHAAESDVLATIEVLIRQLNKYDIPKTVGELHKYCNYDEPVLDYNGKFLLNPKDGYAYFNFGTHKGERAVDNKKYLVWMITKGDFSIDVVNVAKAILDGKIK